MSKIKVSQKFPCYPRLQNFIGFQMEHRGFRLMQILHGSALSRRKSVHQHQLFKRHR